MVGKRCEFNLYFVEQPFNKNEKNLGDGILIKRAFD